MNPTFIENANRAITLAGFDTPSLVQSFHGLANGNSTLTSGESLMPILEKTLSILVMSLVGNVASRTISSAFGNDNPRSPFVIGSTIAGGVAGAFAP